MEPFKIHILGCGSALPTLRHNPSAQVVEIREKQFLVDCGEGTQLQMRRSKIGFNRLCAVFISHIHGDHCFGLIGMLSSFGLLGRTMPLAIYAPKELKPVLDMLLETFCNDFDYEIQFHAVDTKKRAVIYEDRSLTVESIPLKHREPCAGFLFREKPTLPHIRRDMIDFYHIPVSQINNIKNGASWTDEDGNVIPSSRLTRPADPPRSYVLRYVGHQLLDHSDALLLGSGCEVCYARLAAVHTCTTQLLLCDHLTQHCLHGTRSCEEHLRGVLHHESEVGECGAIYCAACAGAHDGADLRYHAA